jgi:Tfp pilus assembly protein PilF
MRFLAEAALLDPHQARYRAQYGYALINQVNMRRIAENELLAALSLEPQNAGFRIMLAELYQKLGLRRRAEGELNRALVDEPGNAAAMALLQAVKKM